MPSHQLLSPHQARLSVALLLALLLAAGFAASAQAEIRTGGQAVRYPDPDASSPTSPQLKRVTVRWDSTGQLTGTVELRDPLADPATTSALRRTFAEITIGDWLSGACVGSDSTWFAVRVPLDDPSKTVLDNGFDVGNTFADIPAQAALDSTRTLITFTASAPVLKSADPICAEATVYREYSENMSDRSSTYGFLLDGFSYLDGAAKREAESDLELQFFWTNNTFRGLHHRGTVSPNPRCTEEYRGRFRCRASSRLPGVPGGPRLSVSGTMTYPETPKDRNFPWVYDLRAKMVWKRCPNRKWVRRSVRGKPCHMTAHFRGTGRLADAF